MNTARLTRRRFIGITAAVAAVAATPFAARAVGSWHASAPKPTIWRGIALGADAELRIYHPDKSFAASLIQKAVAEVARLEKIFSLYREDSILTRLNRTGRLNNPPADLLAVLSRSREIHALTQGAFDPSIQPLWAAYARHFAQQPDRRSAPDAAVLQRALSLVDFGSVHFDNKNIHFAKPGMALSFNGIAQGYITDRITDMLREAGLERALVDMGEIRGLDTHRRDVWQAGIRHPDYAGALLLKVPLQNQALATSGGYGTMLDEAGRFTHLFDPKSGSSSPRYRSVSVMADNAAAADALSTAFAVSSAADIRAAVAQTAAVKAWLVMTDGQIETI
ncbi:FAD:protein FMN transferase [Uruburuella testudinis]|uniref:FAD:protein FMN transferase n=1 Tax=Uruburuella testudinis TaxID=1282863 RepID=A0ABY4DVD2_9NEIS|nr:FAD:protein FMN transferase [Uruburuella testudinis]UOO82423.1 FAD:protein FMN transferase [Uruburuella testudinis]